MLRMTLDGPVLSRTRTPREGGQIVIARRKMYCRSGNRQRLVN